MKVLLNIHNLKKEWMSRRLRVVTQIKSHNLLPSSWSWTSFQIIDWRFCWLSGRSTLQHHVKYLSQWFPGPSPKGPTCTYLNYCVLGQAEYPIVWGLLNTWSESTLIPEELKQHHGSTIGMESYSGQVINGVMAEVWLTMGPLGSQINSVLIYPIPSI